MGGRWGTTTGVGARSGGHQGRGHATGRAAESGTRARGRRHQGDHAGLRDGGSGAAGVRRRRLAAGSQGRAT
eukprot:5653255-Pleurochrysis_carterae.AAC.1